MRAVIHPIAEPLLEYVMTTSDLTSLQEMISEFLKSMYNIQQKSLQSLLDDQFTDEIGKVIKDQLNKAKIDLTNPEEVKTFFYHATETLACCKILSLTLAFHPTLRTVAKCSEYVKREIGKYVVLEINYNPDLVAGAVVIYAGKYVDLSVKKRVSEIIDARKNEILQRIMKSN